VPETARSRVEIDQLKGGTDRKDRGDAQKKEGPRFSPEEVEGEFRGGLQDAEIVVAACLKLAKGEVVSQETIRN
jgi:hypothetical protein